MVAIPTACPVTTPAEDDVMPASAGCEEDHVPPDGEEVYVALVKLQNPEGPEIAVGAALTVTIAAPLQVPPGDV
jgi:hypothetical protein